MVVMRAKAGIDQIRPHMLGDDGAAWPPASIFLNSNESAYGPSPHAIAAARAAVTGIARYLENPDSALAPVIARRFGLRENQITIGHGSDDLLARLHTQAAMLPGGLEALSNQAYLRAALGQGHIVVGAGLSAMPSMHNALAILFALAAFQVGPFIGRVMTGYAMLIWIGSIHLGWHYAIDGIVAALLTWIIWRFSGWATDRLLAQPERPSGRLALA